MAGGGGGGGVDNDGSTEYGSPYTSPENTGLLGAPVLGPSMGSTEPPMVANSDDESSSSSSMYVSMGITSPVPPVP